MRAIGFYTAGVFQSPAIAPTHKKFNSSSDHTGSPCPCKCNADALPLQLAKKKASPLKK